MKVKHIIGLFLFLSLKNLCFAQNAPQGFKYQTAIRDNSGAILANKLISLKISLLRTSPTGETIYIETHNVSTNDFGVANLNIGTGNSSLGNFADIDWSNGPYFLKTELDINNGSNFIFMGTSQLLSVPFALFAAKSGNAANDFDKDSLNEIQQLSLENNQLKLSKNGGQLNLDNYKDNTDSQKISLQGNTLSISGGNSINLNDNDTINEIQTLELNGNQLQLSKNGGTINLTKYSDNTDSQTLILQGTNLSITGGNTISLSGAVDLDSDPTNEIQILSINKDTIRISKSNYILIPRDNDNDSTNEVQTLTVIGNRLFLSKSNQVTLDGDTSNEIQAISHNNDTISLSKSNKIFMPGVPVGTIIAYGGRNIPQGWLLCDGREISRINYSRLFIAIDSVWGAGNRINTFNLPDLRGQFLRGVSDNSMSDPDTLLRTSKFPGGNWGNNVGTYQTDTIKSHNHQMPQGYFTAGSGGNDWASSAGVVRLDRYNPIPTLPSGGNETRPKNANVYYIIKF